MITIRRGGLILCLSMAGLVSMGLAAEGGRGDAAPAMGPFLRRLFTGRPLARESMKYGGRVRDYMLYVPPGLGEGSAPASLLLVLHGGGGSGAGMSRSFPAHRRPAGRGFVIAYPDAVRLGLKRNWNEGRAGAIEGRTALAKVDDVGFLCALVDRLRGRYPIDGRRVFVAGVSNGAFMAQRLAAERAERFAAIAPMIGGMALPVAAAFAPAEPVSVLLVNGTADPLVPFEGGWVHFLRKRLGKTLSVPRIIDLWVRRNGCSSPAQVEELPDRDPEDGARVVRSTWRSTAGGAEVTLLRVVGGGHVWPGGPRYAPRFLIGNTCNDVDAVEEALRFFLAHPKRGAPSPRR